MSDNDVTLSEVPKFDLSAFPPETFFHERRSRGDRRNRGPDAVAVPGATRERRARKERRRRIDPTTFEKQYTAEEMEFMSAIQSFKARTGKSFPSHREVLKVAASLGYFRPARDDDHDEESRDILVTQD
jgi:hypothetical protein